MLMWHLMVKLNSCFKGDTVSYNYLAEIILHGPLKASGPQAPTLLMQYHIHKAHILSSCWLLLSYYDNVAKPEANVHLILLLS